MKISFEVPEEYPWTIMACIALCFEAVFVSTLVVKARKRFFYSDFMKTNFAKLHEENFPGQKISPLGFPDNGNGRYSERLTYKDWVSFNNTQRAHLNIVEQIHFLLVIFLVTGLILPRITMYLAWLGVVGRIAYVIGYIVKGPNARLFGAFLNLIPNYFTTRFAAGVIIVAAVTNSGYIGMPNGFTA